MIYEIITGRMQEHLKVSLHGLPI